MFCYQCQETMKGTGCILKGVCGKESHTAKAMDLLMFVVRGISVVTDEFRNAGHPVAAEVNRFVVDALFCTITNANFDDESILNRVDKGMTLTNCNGRADVMSMLPRRKAWVCCVNPT